MICKTNLVATWIYNLSTSQGCNHSFDKELRKIINRSPNKKVIKDKVRITFKCYGRSKLTPLEFYLLDHLLTLLSCVVKAHDQYSQYISSIVQAYNNFISVEYCKAVV